MQIDDAEDVLLTAIGLRRDPALYSADIVANVNDVRWLYSAKNPAFHDLHDYCIIQNSTQGTKKVQTVLEYRVTSNECKFLGQHSLLMTGYSLLPRSRMIGHAVNPTCHGLSLLS